MSKGTVNKVTIIGRLGADPETRYSAAGNAMATVSVATNFSRRDQDSNEWQEQTEWHRIILFGRQAEVAAQYLRKGNQAYFEGRLQTRKWTGDDGIARYTTEIIAHDLQLLGGRDDNASGYSPPAPNQYNRTTPPPSSSPSAAPSTQAPQAPAADFRPPAADFDDDVPF